MKNDTIAELIALLNTANYDTETLNKKRDEVVNILKKQLSIQRVTIRTFRFSGIRNARKFVREIQATDRESAIADFKLTYPDLTWRTITELD